jgi:two-component system CheB/CheR fusion protein
LVYEQLQNFPIGETYRVWVPGCAGGEEAYTWAILIADFFHSQGKECALQIIANDLNRDALEIARRATYSIKALENLDTNLLSRYFVPVAEVDNEQKLLYKVKESIQKYVYFEFKNVLKQEADTSFHLISCRNLLIYLKRELQEIFLHKCKQMLAHEGLLFLGQSETSGEFLGGGFICISRENRVFKSRA